MQCYAQGKHLFIHVCKFAAWVYTCDSMVYAMWAGWYHSCKEKSRSECA